MPGSSGNGRAGTLRERITHNQAARERRLAELEGVEWSEERSNPTIVVNVGETGKHAAMSKDQADEITKTDHGQPPRPAQESIPEKVADAAGGLVSKADTWPKVVALGLVALVALAAIAAYVVLHR